MTFIYFVKTLFYAIFTFEKRKMFSIFRTKFSIVEFNLQNCNWFIKSMTFSYIVKALFYAIFIFEKRNMLSTSRTKFSIVGFNLQNCNPSYCEGLGYGGDAIRIRMRRTPNSNQYFRWIEFLSWIRKAFINSSFHSWGFWYQRFEIWNDDLTIFFSWVEE